MKWIDIMFIYVSLFSLHLLGANTHLTNGGKVFHLICACIIGIRYVYAWYKHCKSGD